VTGSGARAPVTLEAWLAALASRDTLIEAAAIGGCLLVSALAVHLMRGPERRPGVWFGRRTVDGVLFPLLALALVALARWAMTGVTALALFRLALPVLLSLAVIRLAAGVLTSAFPTSQTVKVVERSVSWMAWIAVVLWITGLLPVLVAEAQALHWKMGGADVSLWSLLEGAFTAAAVLVAVLWLTSALEARLLAGAGTSGPDLSLRKIAANALRALLLFVGLMLALSAAGIPLGALGVVGGAVGVGIGFGLQKLAANYVSGFVILAERSLRIGDMVKVDAFEGRVTDIHTRYTVIRALNGRESIVPNELLITQRVENASLADPRVQMATTVQVAYGTDLDALIPSLVAAVSAVPRVIGDPAPAVLLAAFAADGLELSVVFWIKDPENGQGNVRSEVNLAVLRTLEREGVEIPYPQRVVRQTT